LAISPSATVDARAEVDANVTIWAGTHVREFARIGSNTSIGQYAYLGPGAIIGRDCKIQNGALIYEPAVVGDAVFIGPRALLTNDRYPRAVNPEGTPKTADDWEPVGVTVNFGASIGAGAICVAPITIGTWATVAAGAVVVADVPDFALVAGVPAKRIGWVGRAGRMLVHNGTAWECPVTGELFTGGASATRITPTDS
jgi:UDP-2-acetamido-3-amino-2,3-dideoxy-glucuronate N-acetyltransferase